MHDARRHLNSLGYVIGGKQGRALIVWGYDLDGRRVGIEEANAAAHRGRAANARRISSPKR